jgi:4-alpha-glucanotransferase
MTRTRLHALARHHGLALGYDDPFTGAPAPVPDSTLRLVLEALGQDPDATPDGPPAPARMTVPRDGRAWLPPSLDSAPGWGLFCQLYELRSARNWGIGDFADLANLARLAGAAGADFLGINPVHALFLADPARCSPFSPSNRRFLNPLYIAPDRIEGVSPHPGLAALRASDTLDYEALTRIKIAALRTAYESGAEDAGLDAFLEEEGPPLRQHALFEALSARMVAEGRSAGWRGWTEALRDPDSAETRRLAAALEPETRFHAWLQLQARRQLDAAARAARQSGMRIGLYLDLAVGEAPDGSATWSGTAAALPGLTVGAPPDMFAAQGQNWQLSAPSPTALRAAGFAPLRDMVDAQLRSAGALRIDHVMALWQLFVIPEGEGPAAGTHLRFPFAELLRVLADRSHAREALLIGEDLGFVPEGFRDAMARANILSYRILVFERDAGGFVPPHRYPRKAMASLSTHDLPVLSEWWQGRDIDRRRDFGLTDADQAADEHHRRSEERGALVAAFRRAGSLQAQIDPTAPSLPDGMLAAAHLYLARTPSLLVSVRLADIAGPEAPTNVPGTVSAYPNWRRRSPTDLDALADLPAFRDLAARLRLERPRPEPAP